MLVTDVSPLDGKRRRVYIDYEYAFPLYLSEIRKYGVQTDTELSEAVYAEIMETLGRRVRERILYLIGDMDRTEKNIRDKLRASGYVGRIVDQAVETFKDYGYIDDRRYVRRYAESMRDGRNKSARAIEASLCGKGVSPEIISEEMERLEFDENEQIVKALCRKGYSAGDLSEADGATRRKLYGYLARKGFSYDAISNVMRESKG